jgi:phospholipid/cholesterol/gamma-HCH transport system ATP-binding protein
MEQRPHIEVRNLTMAFGDYVVQRDLSFSIRRGEIFVIMGGSGCGKSTLLRHMVGLQAPAAGSVTFDGVDFWCAPFETQEQIKRRMGVMFQFGALWSSLTLAENVGLPLGEYTDLPPPLIRELVSLKLALVGLAGFEDFTPSELSGGMKKRAGLARAMALDPELLFFDEPSGGLDPLTSKRLDDLILELRASLGTTIVVVTHELPSIFAIADNALMLDSEAKTAIAAGDPKALVSGGPPKVREFLTRGKA